MQMRVAEEGSFVEGSLVVPKAIRERMGILAGDLLDARLEPSDDSDSLLLTLSKVSGPTLPALPEGRIIADPLTGWPVLDFGPDAPELTNEQVLEMLADFP
jgi:hypothetical protein